jgi:protein involved in polysaccharide export with SLBB domain
MKCPSTTRRQWFALAALSLLNLFFIGCASLDGGGNTGASAEAAMMDAPTEVISDVFQIGDLVKVEFSGTTEVIPAHEEHIRDDGVITLYLVGSIKAAGKTPGELQRDIQKAYGRFYRNLNVTVKGSERFYYVGGEVKTPGRQLYLGPITLTGAIKSAGDFTDFAKRTKVELKRASGKMYVINADKALKDSKLDPPIFPGDSITVPRSAW